MVVLGDELPARALREALAILGPVHLGARLPLDLAVEGGRLTHALAHVAHLHAELGRRVALPLHVFCNGKVRDGSFIFTKNISNAAISNFA